jgi:mannitol-1-phosphate 5-dehydrogenase
MKTAVQFGAGNIGRGFMGQLLFESGYKTVFIEAKKELVERLNERKCYPLRILDALSQKEILLKIENIEAVNINETGAAVDAISGADVMSTAVGLKNLAPISAVIAEGVKKRCKTNPSPVDIYLCENILNASDILRSRVFEKLDPVVRKWAEDNIGFVGTAVARMVPEAPSRPGFEDPLLVVADSYHKLAYDQKAVKGRVPGIEGLYPAGNFKAEVERKLFVYNLGHAALAYLGSLKGFSYIHETIKDSECYPVFDRALDETSSALLKQYPEDFDIQGQKEVREDIRLRYGNPMIMDTVHRVGRDPIRKLGPEDRLIGSAKLCISQGIFPENIAHICAAALCYNFQQDPEAVKLQEMIKDQGVEAVLEQVSNIDTGGALGKKIIYYYRELQK